MPVSYLSLGGNLGDVVATFRQAIEQLASVPGIEVRRRSRTFQTAPVGDDAGETFRNAVVEILTDQPPHVLLSTIHRIEDSLGRTRTKTWGPRTLDLDLLFYGEDTFSDPQLSVPHSACWYRRFVLDPLAEIAPEFVHPEKGLSIRQLRDRLLLRPLPLAVAGASSDTRTGLINQLQAEFPQIRLIDWVPNPESSAYQPAIIAWLGPQSPDPANGTRWDSLPRCSRLDLSADIESAERHLRHVILSVLGS